MLLIFLQEYKYLCFMKYVCSNINTILCYGVNVELCHVVTEQYDNLVRKTMC